MSIAELAARAHRVGPWLVATRRRPAVAWASATFLALAVLAGAPGISRDEAAVLERATDARRVAASPEPAGRPSPPLGGEAAAATHAVFSRLGVPHVHAARLATALFGAVLSAAIALLAWDLAGGTAALLAPALFWAAPRHLHAGLVATPDLALAALVAAAVLAYRRASVAPERRARLRAAALAGVIFGAAVAARADAWVLLPALAVHAGVARALNAIAVRDDLEQRLHGVPLALIAMIALGPVVLLATWPSLWPSPFLRLAAAFAPSGAVPSVRPVLVTALTVPVTILLAYLAGIGHALLRIGRVLHGRALAAVASDEALLLLCAATPFAAAAVGIAPSFAGVRPWLHAMPFLAVLGARALLAAARVASPARAAPLAASLVLCVLWPGLRATAHFHPAGASSWNEIAGGAPGAATLGLPRQDGGEAAAALLPILNARASAGARVFWPTAAPAALRALSRDGRLRPDLVAVDGPEDADLAVVTLEGAGASRDAEYRAWSAFRTARPAAGAYLDEVPLALVYARAGSWR